MACAASRVRERIVVIYMARAALDCHVRSCKSETSAGVIPGRVCPAGGVMAQRAIGRVTRLSVWRIGRTVVIGQMARAAGGIRQRVVVVHMAQIAGHGDVRTRESEASARVIPRRGSPVRCGVARRTGSRKPCSRMRRSVGAVVIGGVAAVAIGRQGATVIVVHVAGGTGHAHVGSCQREGCGVVVESGGLPSGGVVAGLASGGEAGADMIGICCSCEILGMAAIAIGRSRSVISIEVAAGAGNRDVGSGEREGSLAVVKRRWLPG
jgi:hypothetical protein